MSASLSRLTFFLLALCLCAPAFAAGHFAVENIEVYDAPNGSPMMQLYEGTEVAIYGVRGDWTRISPEREPPRWVRSSKLCSGNSCWKASPQGRADYPASGSPNYYSGQNQYRSPRSQQNHSPEQKQAKPAKQSGGSGQCPCSGSQDCIGPRGGHYCITSGGNKRYR